MQINTCTQAITLEIEHKLYIIYYDCMSKTQMMKYTLAHTHAHTHTLAMATALAAAEHNKFSFII